MAIYRKLHSSNIMLLVKTVFTDTNRRVIFMCFENIKKRMQLEKEEFVKIPYELKFLAYFMELTYDDYQKLEVF